jgi:hypothetical protein
MNIKALSVMWVTHRMMTGITLPATIAVMPRPIQWHYGLRKQARSVRVQAPAIRPINILFPFFRLRHLIDLPEAES